MSRFIITTSVLFVLSTAFFSQASAAGGGPQSMDDVLNILNRFQTWFATAFWIFAIGFGLYSAYLFLFAAKEPKNYDAAKNALFYTIIAMAIGIIVYGLPTLIQNILNP